MSDNQDWIKERAAINNRLAHYYIAVRAENYAALKDRYDELLTDLRALLAKSEEDERENERLREELALRGGLIEKQSSQATHELTTSTLTPEGPA